MYVQIFECFYSTLNNNDLGAVEINYNDKFDKFDKFEL